jgi:hypothetical protein
MENIIVSNIVMYDVNHYPIYVSLGQRNRGPKESTSTGIVKNIFISNIIATNVDSLSGIQIIGSPEHVVENISLQNIRIEYKGGGTKNQALINYPELNNGYPEPSLLGPNPAYGLYARHVKNLQLTNISFKTLKQDNRPVIICYDVDGLDIDDLKATIVKGIKPFVFKNVMNSSTRYSPLFQTKITK